MSFRLTHVQLLLEEGYFRPDHLDSRGMTPLYYTLACQTKVSRSPARSLPPPFPLPTSSPLPQSRSLARSERDSSPRYLYTNSVRIPINNIYIYTYRHGPKYGRGKRACATAPISCSSTGPTSSVTPLRTVRSPLRSCSQVLSGVARGVARVLLWCCYSLTCSSRALRVARDPPV